MKLKTSGSLYDRKEVGSPDSKEADVVVVSKCAGSKHKVLKEGIELKTPGKREGKVATYHMPCILKSRYI